MKKILSMLVVVSIVALSAMGAFAADFLPDDNGRYTVEVTGLQPGEMYGMVAIKGTQASQITEANIVYIDQATADSEGKIAFTSFGTMGAAPDAEGFVEATVFVGGAGYTSATAIGTLKAAAAPEPDEPVAQTVAISGLVTDHTYTKPVIVTAVNASDVEIDSAAVDTTGAYTLNVPKDETFNLKFSKDGYVNLTYTGLSFAENGTIKDVNMKPYAGNIDGNVEVYFPDLSAMLSDYRKSTGFNPRADIDGNGEVYFPDFSILLQNYRNADTTEVYSAE